MVRLLHGAAVVSVAQLQAPEVVFENLPLSGPMAPTQVQLRAEPRTRGRVRLHRRPDRPRRLRRGLPDRTRALTRQHDQRSLPTSHQDADHEPGRLEAADVVIRHSLAANIDAPAPEQHP